MEKIVCTATTKLTAEECMAKLDALLANREIAAACDGQMRNKNPRLLGCRWRYRNLARKVKALEQENAKLREKLAPPAATPEPPPQKGDGRCVHDELAEMIPNDWSAKPFLEPKILNDAVNLACAIGDPDGYQFKRDILARKEFGLRKYGTTLQPHNGRDALNDAYQEALDLCCYLMQRHMEQTAAPPGAALEE